MKKTMSGAFVLVAVLGLYAAPALALRSKSVNTVYLDSAGNVIGEKIGYCAGPTKSAGITSSQFYVQDTRGCGNDIVHCESGHCSVVGQDYSQKITFQTFAPTSQSEVCYKYWGDDCGRILDTQWVADGWGIPFPG